MPAPITPTSSAAHGSTLAQLAVTETSPAITPLSVGCRSFTPCTSACTAYAHAPPAVPPSVVLMITRPATNASSPVLASTEKPLKPYQPNQSSTVPIVESTRLCGLIGTGAPSLAKRPWRGPSSTAPTPPATPPTMWTTPEPAKSTNGAPTPSALSGAASAACSDHAQWTTHG